MKKELFKKSCRLFNRIRTLESKGEAGTAEHRQMVRVYRQQCSELMQMDLYGQYVNYLKRRI